MKAETTTTAEKTTKPQAAPKASRKKDMKWFYFVEFEDGTRTVLGFSSAGEKNEWFKSQSGMIKLWNTYKIRGYAQEIKVNLSVN